MNRTSSADLEPCTLTVYTEPYTPSAEPYTPAPNHVCIYILNGKPDVYILNGKADLQRSLVLRHQARAVLLLHRDLEPYASTVYPDRMYTNHIR